VNSTEIELNLIVEEPGADRERIFDLTNSLNRELLDLGVGQVARPAEGAVPEGAKGEPFTWGVLALAVVPTLLPKLVEFIQSWALRGENRVVKIKTPQGLEIEFTPEKKLSKAEYLDLVAKLTAAPDQANKLAEEKIDQEKS
jgi:hypothetical protein